MPFSYRQLWRMYVGKIRHDWNQTAQVNAYQLVAGGAKNVDINEFNPIVKMFRQVTPEDIEAGWNIAARMGRVTTNEPN